MPNRIIILLVDDDPEDQQILKEYLLKQNESIIFYHAANGKEAIDLLNQENNFFPDLMIFDFKMPLMGGLDILKYLKEKKSFQLTPKVVWSTSGQNSLQQICIENGAVAYFVKPAGPSELTELAKNLLKFID